MFRGANRSLPAMLEQKERKKEQISTRSRGDTLLPGLNQKV